MMSEAPLQLQHETSTCCPAQIMELFCRQRVQGVVYPSWRQYQVCRFHSTTRALRSWPLVDAVTYWRPVQGIVPVVCNKLDTTTPMEGLPTRGFTARRRVSIRYEQFSNLRYISKDHLLKRWEPYIHEFLWQNLAPLNGEQTDTVSGLSAWRRGVSSKQSLWEPTQLTIKLTSYCGHVNLHTSLTLNPPLYLRTFDFAFDL